MTASNANSRLRADSYSADRVDAHIGANFIHVERNRSFYLHVTFFRDAEPLAWISDKKYKNYTEDAEVESRGRLYLHRGSILCDLTLGIKASKRAKPLLMTFCFNENFKIASVNTNLSLVDGSIESIYNTHECLCPDSWFSIFDVMTVSQKLVQCCGRTIKLVKFWDDAIVVRAVVDAEFGIEKEGACSPIPERRRDTAGNSCDSFNDDDVPF